MFTSKKCHELSSVADLTLAADGAKTVQGAEVKSDQNLRELSGHKFSEIVISRAYRP